MAVCSYEELLSYLENNLTNEDVRQLINACPKHDRDRIKNLKDFYDFLASRGALGKDNVIQLQRALETIARPDLVNTVMNFRRISISSEDDLNEKDDEHENKYNYLSQIEDIVDTFVKLELKPPPKQIKT